MGCSLKIGIRGRVEKGGEEDVGQAAEPIDERAVEEMLNKGVILGGLRGDGAEGFEGGYSEALGGINQVKLEVANLNIEGFTVRGGNSGELQSDHGEEGI
jgi:hypothetical protein